MWTKIFLVLLLCDIAQPANDFTGDSHCLGLYRLENGALGTDSKGTYDMADWPAAASADTVNYQEGAASGDFEDAGAGNGDGLRIEVSSLPATWPFSDDLLGGTICAWFRLESDTGQLMMLTGSFAALDGYRNMYLGVVTSSLVVRLTISNNGGLSGGTMTADSSRTLSTGVWYHVAASYNGANDAWHIRLYDTSNTTVYDDTNTYPSSLNVGTGGTPYWTIGTGYWTNSAYDYAWDGLIDEVVIFDDILSNDEIDQVRAGTYAEGVSAGTAAQVISVGMD